MIRLENVTKMPRGTRQAPKPILSDVSLEIPSDRCIALLGHAAEETSALIDLLAGVTLPNSGRIFRECNVSFPVGFLGGFDPELSLGSNIAHTAHLYNVDRDALVDFVARTARLSSALERPFGEMPSHLRLPTAIALTFGLPFDVYLMKDDFSRIKGDTGGFRPIAFELFKARIKSSGAIIATKNPKFISEHCDMALLLHGGRLALFKSPADAYGAWEHIQTTMVLPARRQLRDTFTQDAVSGGGADV